MSIIYSRLNKIGYINFLNTLQQKIQSEFNFTWPEKLKFNDSIASHLGFNSHNLLMNKMVIPERLIKYGQLKDMSPEDFIEMVDTEIETNFDGMWGERFLLFSIMTFSALKILQEKEELTITIDLLKKYSQPEFIKYLSLAIQNLKNTDNNQIYEQFNYYLLSYSEYTHKVMSDKLAHFLGTIPEIDKNIDDYSIIMTERKFKQLSRALYNDLKNMNISHISLQKIQEMIISCIGYKNLHEAQKKQFQSEYFLQNFKAKEIKNTFSFIYNEKYYFDFLLKNNKITCSDSTYNQDGWQDFKHSCLDNLLPVVSHIIQWLNEEDKLIINTTTIRKFLIIENIILIYKRHDMPVKIRKMIEEYFDKINLKINQPINENTGDMHGFSQMQIVKILCSIEEMSSHNDIAKPEWFSFNEKNKIIYINPQYKYLIKSYPYINTDNYKKWIWEMKYNKKLKRPLNLFDLLDSILNMKNEDLKKQSTLLFYYILNN